ncbi:unnamed protein product [marine sediment metagenome]|uniref:Uncharacterized protein n=1 Tax=marine sediment metagenome TaxID=412755 RepID=X0SPV8_9ZZZZ
MALPMAHEATYAVERIVENGLLARGYVIDHVRRPSGVRTTMGIRIAPNFHGDRETTMNRFILSVVDRFCILRDNCDGGIFHGLGCTIRVTRAGELEYAVFGCITRHE